MLKQTLILARAKNCFNRNSFCPTYGKRHAYSYDMVKAALYPIIIQVSSIDVSNRYRKSIIHIRLAFFLWDIDK